jgi:transposase
VLAAWLPWAARCRIDAFVRLAKRIRHHLTGIHATLGSGLSNARVEANNTHLRVLTRQGYGYHSPEALIAMAMLRRGGLFPPLPGRTSPTHKISRRSPFGLLSCVVVWHVRRGPVL